MNEVITSWDIYWLTRLDGLRTAACLACFVSGISGAFAGTLGAMMRSDGDENGLVLHRLCMKLILPVFLASSAFCAFVPTLKEAAAIYVIPKLANSEEVQGLGNEMVTLAREWLVELRPGGGK